MNIILIFLIALGIFVKNFSLLPLQPPSNDTILEDFLDLLNIFQYLNSPQNLNITKIPKPEVRGARDIIEAAMKNNPMDLLKFKLKELIALVFGKATTTVTCDAYKIYRARLTELIVQLTQGSKGSYLVYDPQSKYYKNMMYGPLLKKLPTVPEGIVLGDSPFADPEWVRSERAVEECESITKEVPYFRKLIDFLLESPFIPQKVKDMYNKADRTSKTYIGKNILRLIGRGIQLGNSKGKIEKGYPNSTFWINTTETNLDFLRNIVKMQPKEKDKITKSLEKILDEQKAVKPTKVETIYKPSPYLYATKERLPLFGPDFRQG